MYMKSQQCTVKSVDLAKKQGWWSRSEGSTLAKKSCICLRYSTAFSQPELIYITALLWVNTVVQRV